MGWLVTKVTFALGDPLRVYLRTPRRRTTSGGTVETWDEKHDALVFDSWCAAAWQALRHFAWVTPSGSAGDR